MFTAMISSVQSLSRVRLFATPQTAARQASLSITISQSSPKLCPLNRWCHQWTSNYDKGWLHLPQGNGLTRFPKHVVRHEVTTVIWEAEGKISWGGYSQTPQPQKHPQGLVFYCKDNAWGYRFQGFSFFLFLRLYWIWYNIASVWCFGFLAMRHDP